jgi:hypothetical protein
MRSMYCVAAALGAMALLNGCAFYPDFQTSPVYHVPIAEVVNQIRCEMYDFVRSQQRVPNPNFSLDPDSYATVELALSTTAFGDVKFAKIDTKKLGAAGFLAIGSSTQPFPSLDVKNVDQTIAKVVVNISQNPKLLEKACGYGQWQILSDEPHADRVLVNDLRLSEWLKHSFASAQRIQSRGGVCDTRGKKTDVTQDCSVSLETATLTTKFELIADASAGVLDLAKLIPIVATPTLDLNIDYYHQIQIIFSGNNAINVAQKGAPPGGHNKFAAPYVESTREGDISVSILRTLRSIRDETILNGQRP